jgi:shikimate kinase
MSAWAGISVVNALPSGLGATTAISLRVDATLSNTCTDSENLSQLVKTILKYFENRYSLPKFCIKILSQVPPGSGLKSSSAVAVALIKAIIYKYSLYEPNIPRLAAELSKIAGVSFTGALDDAAAAYYGGIVFTDNTNMKIIRVDDVRDDLNVVILIPRDIKRPYISLNEMRRYSSLFNTIFERAFQGDFFKAMTMNGIAIAKILYPNLEDIIVKALKLGALAAGVSGNGPSLFAVCREGDEEFFQELFSSYGDVLKAKFVRFGEEM